MACLISLSEVRTTSLPDKLEFAATGNYQDAAGTPLGNALQIFDATTQIDLFETIRKELLATYQPR